MSDHPDFDPTSEQNLNQLLGELRPRLHRYCSRMTGSVIDGEDVVQEALLRAYVAFSKTEPLANPEGWLFRIAHNAALDFLRRRMRQLAAQSDEDPDTIAILLDPVRDRFAAAACLSAFMRLPAAQRSSVILKDVLGYSIEEISEITDLTIPAVKSALQRGRMRLRELRDEPETPFPRLPEREGVRLAKYIEHFNARDFDAVRSMLAEDVKLDLINRARRTGRKEVSEYFHRYSLQDTWHCAPGFIDGHPGILMFDSNDLSDKPSYFVLLEWSDEGITGIRDFFFARYALEGAKLVLVDEL